jgi:hypothetical protein
MGALLPICSASRARSAAGGRSRRDSWAERLAGEGDQSTPELRCRVRDRIALALNSVAALAMAAVLLLMIWQPR